jgi:hypothetical protein
MGSSYGTIDTVSGERLDVIRGSGDIQIIITWQQDKEERIRLSINEARDLLTLLREATDTEQKLLDSTQSG